MFIFPFIRTQTSICTGNPVGGPAWSLFMPLLLVQSVGNLYKSDLGTSTPFLPLWWAGSQYSVFHFQLLFSVSSAAMHFSPSLKWRLWAGVNLLYWPLAQNNNISRASVLTCLLFCFACRPGLPTQHLWPMDTLFWWPQCLIGALRSHHKAVSPLEGEQCHVDIHHQAVSSLKRLQAGWLSCGSVLELSKPFFAQRFLYSQCILEEHPCPRTSFVWSVVLESSYFSVPLVLQ